MSLRTGLREVGNGHSQGDTFYVGGKTFFSNFTKMKFIENFLLIPYQKKILSYGNAMEVILEQNRKFDLISGEDVASTKQAKKQEQCKIKENTIYTQTL